MARAGSLWFRELPAHLKVPWRVIDALVVFAGAWLILPVFLTLTILFLGHAVPPLGAFAHALTAKDFEGEAWANSLLDTLSAAGGLALVYYYLRRNGVSWTAVGWRSFSVKKALLYFLVIFSLFIALVTILLAIAALIPGFNASQAQTTEFTRNGQGGSWAFLSLVIVPPILEETVFRGFIFPAFAQRWGTLWGAIASSALFGFAHLQGNIGLYTFVLGILLCYMYARLKSIFPGMALHVFNNYLAFMAMNSK